jgi:Clp amino terminal domain, pathogenicity island component
MSRMRPPIRRGPAPGGPAGGQGAGGQGAGGGLRRLTPEARALHHTAFGHAIRLGHPYVGGEHFLLAIVGTDDPVAAVLREHGVTPERVEEQVVLLWDGGLFGDLDSSALAAIGVDLDAVRTRVTGAFDADALQRAGQRVPRPGDGGPWWDPRRRHVGPGMHMNGVFLPITRDVVRSVRQARLAEQARHDTQIGVAHFALGLLSVTDGLVPPVLAGLGVSPQALRAALTAVG